MSSMILRRIFFSFGFLLASGFFTAGTVQAASYYVDSSAGNDANSCTQAQSQATPRRTVNGITACNPGAGDTVYFRGTFNQTINAPQSGQIVQATTSISGVNGNQVTFNTTPAGVSSTTDYVYVYGSRKGNSGAFKVSAVSGSTITVDTSSLPGGNFLAESAGDPGDLQAAVIRPVVYTAWDKNNPPTWNFNSALYYGFNRQAVMLSYLRSLSGASNEVWGAIYLDGSNNGSNDYFVADHVEIQNAATSIGLSNNDFHASYGIVQHSRFQNVGYAGGVSDEVIYWGNFLQSQKNHDYVQIMYNQIGPQKQVPVTSATGQQAVGDGIEIKASSHYPTVFGNIITGMYLTYGCDDSPIRSAGANGFIANNYISNVYPTPNNIPGCGISIVEGAAGANGTIVANNVIANVKSTGIRVFNTSNVQVLNNTIYNITSIPGCCADESMGIMIQTDGQAATGNVVRNNIVVNAPVGIGRYPWSLGPQFSVTTGNNIVFNTPTAAWGVGITAQATDRVINPNLINPAGGNFAIGAGSPAIGAGANLASVLQIDNHNATNVTQISTAPVVRAATWDVGAYTVAGGAPAPSPSVVPTVIPTPSPIVISPTPAVTPKPANSPSPAPDLACRAADINQDGTVNLADRSLILLYFFQAKPAVVRADINVDGIVDLTDYGLLVKSFAQNCP